MKLLLFKLVKKKLHYKNVQNCINHVVEAFRKDLFNHHIMQNLNPIIVVK